ncbi:N-acetylneuraminate (7)9-O-acetyltransferase-like isoform X2 [Tubulanus polymorphus]|uniref:N-acetylneuraminate (7)9-O-acetyltransferase-like isoform X2 n=1 Tax=Tubulanus polymorphus TaxID=672921 RepID=UPI003DA5C1A0
MVEQRKHSHASPEIPQFVTVENAKVVAFSMVVTFVLYHGLIHLKYGSDSCQWLLSDGRFQGYNAWQPYGCMMHRYSKSDSRNCMHYISYWGGYNHIVFLGDSRIRQLYHEFVGMFSNKPPQKGKQHHDMHFSDEKINLKVDFLWQPMVSDTMYNVYKSWLKMEPRDRPNLVITGSATWSVKLSNGSKEFLGNFKVNLTYIVPYFNKLKSTMKVLWMLQDPVVESRLVPNHSMITNERIDEYNRAAIDILRHSTAKVWSSSRLITQGYNHDMNDGLHAGHVALDWDNQIVMNMYCNDHMGYNDGTCCSSAEPVTKLQIFVAGFFLFCIVLSLSMYIYKRRNKRNGNKTRNSVHSDNNGQRLANTPPTVGKNNEEDVYYIVFTNLARLGVIMAYFFICDRTNFFMKENKAYTLLNFLLPLGYVMVLGFFFTDNTDKTTMLHRDQTDEWKGWMQLVILIYHITGASRVLPIYMHIRVLVSAYLFLSGYGHFHYFWSKGEHSLNRFCQVLFRMNMLVVTLCFVMNRPYQFYYFVPLISFWFIIIYVVLSVWPRLSASSAEANIFHYLYMMVKFLVLILIVTLLYVSEVLFEKIFLTNPFKAFFVTLDDSLHEWRFRWQLDRYSFIYGMIFAFVYMILKHFRLINDEGEETLFSRTVSFIVAGCSVLGIAGYAVFSVLCRSKQECNELHPYLTFLPIVSYIFLRNTWGSLRSRYSSFFAWFGKISLELFIAQYHIWLAADTHGVLVLIPSNQVLNIIITTFIFVCTCHEIHKVTETLTKYAIPTDWKLVLRNVVCFTIILIPIGWTHGVFS